MLLPCEGSAFRRTLEGWFDGLAIRPRVIAEFEDSALMKVFGGDGRGVFAPTASPPTRSSGSTGSRWSGARRRRGSGSTRSPANAG